MKNHTRHVNKKNQTDRPDKRVRESQTRLDTDRPDHKGVFQVAEAGQSIGRHPNTDRHSGQEGREEPFYFEDSCPPLCGVVLDLIVSLCLSSRSAALPLLLATGKGLGVGVY